MKTFFLLPVLCSFCSFTACSQNPGYKQNDPGKATVQVGGRCEGCEAIYECPVPFEQLNETDTLPDFNDPGPKITISGIIYRADGKTPAGDVVLYVYHTNQNGIYPTKGNEKGWAKRHGHIRAWVKTNAQGQYKFYTLVPASYPNSTIPKHIHAVIKEADKTPYWIDEFLFDDDPLLPEKERANTKPAGGTGILKTYRKDGMLGATRNIIAGLNVDGYPSAAIKNIEPGATIAFNWMVLIPYLFPGIDQ